jgi:hypothetical protein
MIQGGARNLALNVRELRDSSSSANKEEIGAASAALFDYL